MKKIKVTIDKNGIPRIEAEGFAGVGCKDATRPIEDAFGGKGQSTEKPEIYLEEENQTEARQW
jgi:hypothetical protein